METFEVGAYASELFEKKYKKHIRKYYIKNFIDDIEDERKESLKKEFFMLLLEDNPWEHYNPKYQTIKFVNRYFFLIK